MAPVVSRPRFFKSPAEFRAWLEAHHATAKELWVGYHRVATGRPSLTWPESVGEALCFGWIDGIRKTVDATRYTIRFTPRRPGSNWSKVNLARARQLIKQGRMHPAGLGALEAGLAGRGGKDSIRESPARLPPRFMKLLKSDRKAWAYYRSRPPGYQRLAAGWVTSAKKEETRLRRLAILIEASAQGKAIPPLARPRRSG